MSSKTKSQFFSSGSILTWMERHDCYDPHLALCLAIITIDPGTDPCWAHEHIDAILGDGMARLIEEHYSAQLSG